MRTFICVMITLVLITLAAMSVEGQEPIQLNPGETLVSIEGVPVACTSGRCPIAKTVKAVVRSAKAIGHGTVAYAHALREAQLMARANRASHLMGVAPGCTFSGVGYSYSVEQPSHCKTNKTLVARAYCVGADGRVYWSAHYR